MIKQLNAAISAHVAWVGRFQSAVSRATREAISVEEAGDFRSCELGRWLAGEPASLEPAHREQIDGLHRAFHAEAARIAAMLSTEPVGAVAAAMRERLVPRSVQLISALLDAERHYRSPAPAGHAAD